jgi:hypothetical protein
MEDVRNERRVRSDVHESADASLERPSTGLHILHIGGLAGSIDGDPALGGTCKALTLIAVGIGRVHSGRTRMHEVIAVNLMHPSCLSAPPPSRRAATSSISL